MKTKLVFTALLLIAVFFGFKNPSEGSKEISDLSPKDNQFLITAMHAGDVDPNYIYLPDLGINAWHKYTGPLDFGWPGISNDNYLTPTADYEVAVKQRIDNNRNHGFRSIMDRPKIEYLAFGQRSEYQCEDSSRVDPDFWFYSYKTHNAGQDIQDNSQFGNNQWVKFCDADTVNPGSNQGYVVKDLRANREQANRYWPAWIADSAYKWYVMPKIRIPLNIPNSTPVCKVEVLDWDSNIVKSIVLTARQFKDINFNYSGNYMEEFYLIPDQDPIAIDIPEGAMCPGDRRDFGDWVGVPVSTDFRVYWYGQCDMWIDYVKVENQPAHELFKGQWDQQIREETDIALQNYDPLNPIPNNFYVEEFEFNIVSALSYVDSIVQAYDSRISIMANLNYPLFSVHIPLDNNNHRDELTAEYIDKHLIKKANLKYLVNVSYPLEGFTGTLYPVEDKRTSAHPNTLSQGDYNATSGMLSYKVTPQEYEIWLQDKLDIGIGSGGGFKRVMSLTDSLTKYFNNPDLRIIHLAQAHSWWSRGHKLKEPSNEEINLMTDLSISYGAKGIMYFAYNSTNQTYDTTNGNIYECGIADSDGTPRDSNVYGQNKWEGVKKINSTLNKWGPYLMSFDNANGKSYIYRIPSERTEMTNSTFISELKTYPHVEFDPNPPDPDELDNLLTDSGSSVYLQAAFFNDPNDTEINKYFMVVNRRCSPFINDSTPGNVGGRRFVSMKVNPGYLPNFNNWKLIDLETGDTSRTFDKNSTSVIYIGDFMPGEGKLFRVAPVMQEGGTLVADESVSSNFDCKGEVNNGGKNITLIPSTTINFTNADARIIMNGGNFKSGVTTGENTAPVTLHGKDGNLWKGIVLQNCPIVDMSVTYFDNISPYELDSTYAVDLVNCRFININGCTFQSQRNLNSGGIRANFTSIDDKDIEAYIFNSTFKMDDGNIPALSFISSGGLTLPLIIENNTFISLSTNSANAIFLSNISGGVIKDNTITEYKNSIFMLSSSMDFYNNTITGSYDNSIGISGYSQSNMSLANSGIFYTGGLNVISTDGSDSKCLFVDKSNFDIYKGENIFNLSNYPSGNTFHLSGWLPSYPPNGSPVDVYGNCYQISENNTNAVHDVKWVNGIPVNFNFEPYSCEIIKPDQKYVVDLGNGISDTIYYKSQGSGGGKKNPEIVTVRSLLDSININMRRRNYNSVNTDCREILENYSDSIQSAGLISKLYLANLRLDSSGNRITDLKSFLETLILNNPLNESLIKSAFYYIQKCKVELEDYESAMNGFQQIINQNPYSYEALTASWDYAATSLLIQGQGGGERDMEIGISDLEFEDNNSEYLNDDPNEKYDKNTFTKDDRKVIKENVFHSFETSRDKEIEIVKSLEKKVAEGKADESEKKELEIKKVLKDIAKPKKPVNITEHISNVSGDINKITETGKGNSLNKNVNSIPDVFYLSQNYPNPFNPNTKISFDLPVDSKVKLIVYDMLGREMKTIVNSQLSASRYEFDFNGSNLASGVYFYRIEAVENSGKKFVQVKRMVLVK